MGNKGILLVLVMALFQPAHSEGGMLESAGSKKEIIDWAKRTFAGGYVRSQSLRAAGRSFFVVEVDPCSPGTCDEALFYMRGRSHWHHILGKWLYNASWGYHSHVQTRYRVDEALKEVVVLSEDGQRLLEVPFVSISYAPMD